MQNIFLEKVSPRVSKLIINNFKDIFKPTIFIKTGIYILAIKKWQNTALHGGDNSG